MFRSATNYLKFFLEEPVRNPNNILTLKYPHYIGDEIKASEEDDGFVIIKSKSSEKNKGVVGDRTEL